MAKSPAAILYDASGNPVAVTLDGGVYRLETEGKVLNAAGTQINPATQETAALQATEATLAAIKTKTDNLDVALSTRAVTGLTDAQLRASAVPVSAASLPLPAGAATQATLATRASEATLATRLAEATFTARVNTQGQKVMAASTPTVIASDQSAIASKNAAASQVDGHSASIGATTDADTALTIIGRLKQLVTQITSIKDTAGIKKITDGVQLQAGTNSIGKIKIEDGLGNGYLAAVDGSNRLIVSSNVVVPPGDVAVNVEAISNLNGSDDTVYVIPNTKVLTISRLAGGSEGNSGKVSKVSLYYDPNGNGTGMTLIRAMYLGTTNWEFSLDYQATGNGTIAIRLRRERLDGSSDEVAGFWDGHRTP